MEVRIRLLVSSFTFMVGIGAIIATLPIVLRSISTNRVEISLAVTVWGLTYLLSNIPAGFLADRIGANRIVPIAFLANVPLGFLMYFGQTALEYTLARALEGVMEALVWTSIIGLMVKNTQDTKILGVSSIYATITLGFTLGPLAANILSSFSSRAPFLLYSSCSVISFLMTASLFKLDTVKLEKVKIKVELGKKTILPLLNALTVGLIESLLIVYAPEISQETKLLSPESLVSEYYFFGLLGQVSVGALYTFILSEHYISLAFIMLGLTFIIVPGSMMFVSIALLGFINAHITSRAQAKIAENMPGVESTGAGLANFAWALGYFLGAPFYSALNPGSLAPQVAIATIVITMLIVYLVIYYLGNPHQRAKA
ncbi:MFS transporter [Infirmifilum uzonense]|nr:MFS transporter [Infirmifilum uzonense]